MMSWSETYKTSSKNTNGAILKLHRNDEVLERISIDRRCKNDTDRLEKLFELYTKMTSQPASSKKSAKPKTNGSNP